VDTNGTVVAHREFDAFGSTIVATGNMVHTLHFWFSTKYLDDETGLYYYGYRYYSPGLGRWLNRDPIGEKGAFNLYVMIANHSVDAVDALGLAYGNPVPPIVISQPPPPPIQQNTGPRKCCGSASYNPITHCCCESTKKIHDLGTPFKWSGTIAYSEFGYFLQFTAMNCNLKSNTRSDCKRFTANITAFLGGLTYGPAIGGAVSQITFNNSPSFYEGFNGGVSFIGVGGAIAGGLSAAIVRIGDGITFSGGIELGFEIPGGAILAGHTVAVSGFEIPCDQW
jgi:RHS repeat-associated protein